MKKLACLTLVVAAMFATAGCDDFDVIVYDSPGYGYDTVYYDDYYYDDYYYEDTYYDDSWYDFSFWLW